MKLRSDFTRMVKVLLAILLEIVSVKGNICKAGSKVNSIRYSETIVNYTLVGPVMSNITAKNERECEIECHLAVPFDMCYMFNYYPSSKVCELLYKDRAAEYKVEKKNGSTFKTRKCLTNPCLPGHACFNLGDQTNNSCLFVKDIDECASNPCQNGATCQDQVNSYTCTCAAGYTGDKCQTDIDECASNPCQNGATCQDQVNSYNCTCAAGFEGVNCQIEWMKVTSTAVCIGAKDDKFGSFTIQDACHVLTFKLVHVSGEGVNFERKGSSSRAYWGSPHNNNNKDLNIHITDTSNNRISPPLNFPLFHSGGGYLTYRLPGVTNKDPELTLPELSPPLAVTAGKEFRIWFDEDLNDYTEYNNVGQTCADVWIKKY